MVRHNIKLSEISSLMNVEYDGIDCVIENLNLCNRPSSYNSILGYVTSTKFFDAVVRNKALRALVISQELKDELVNFIDGKKELSYIISDNPEHLFYDIHNALYHTYEFYDFNDYAPIIGANCNIHPSAVIENVVKIGNNVTIGPNSVIRRNTIIEDNVNIGCCSVIGSEGFQAILGYHKPIKHVGGTYICRNVWIGDNTTVGNALFEGNTVVGAFSKLDNHVHFAHNNKCGEGCVITASSLLMGSTALDNYVWLAPNAVILNGVHIYDNGFVGTLSFANKDVNPKEVVAGIPARVIKTNK
jgi:UDP-3-O-[3-hydroxymyristoyl] glucosamine N-acyltransferase